MQGLRQDQDFRHFSKGFLGSRSCKESNVLGFCTAVASLRELVRSPSSCRSAGHTSLAEKDLTAREVGEGAAGQLGRKAVYHVKQWLEPCYAPMICLHSIVSGPKVCGGAEHSHEWSLRLGVFLYGGRSVSCGGQLP